MQGQVSVADILRDLQARVPYAWIAGKNAGARLVSEQEAREGDAPLVGHFNLIHANQIQVLGATEMRYLEQLSGEEFEENCRKLFAGVADIVILAEGIQPHPMFIELANATNIALLTTPEPSYDLLVDLRQILGEHLAESVTLHGVFMEVVGIGLLIVGDASIGKSELALELLSRGHRLVADDAPIFSKVSPNILSGRSPDLLRDFLEVRGLGLLDIRAMFGASAIKEKKQLRLIVRLIPFEEVQFDEDSRISGMVAQREILGVNVPEITLPIAPGRNLAVLVETAARNFLLQQSGYNAVAAFQARLNQQLKDPGQ